MEPGTGMGSMGSNIYYAKMFALVGDRDRDQAVPFPVPPRFQSRTMRKP